MQKGAGNYEPIFKDPKTDSKKKSAKGLLMVVEGVDGYELVSDVTKEEELSANNELKTVYKDGQLLVETSLKEIRERINNTF